MGRHGWAGASANLGSVQSVLVASDSRDLRHEIGAIVGSAEIEVLEASSGPEVIEVVHETPVELVVVDMQMGSMGGMAVCLELRLEESYSDVEHIPVLMLVDRRPDVFLARRSGAEGWLVKPLDPLRIRRAVHTLLAGGTFPDDSYLPVPVLAGAQKAGGVLEEPAG